MRLTVETLEQHHLDELRVTVQPMQADFARTISNDPSFLEAMRICGPTRAFLNGAQVLGCAGLVVFPNTGRANLWCAYAADAGRDFLWIFKRGLRELLEQNWRRVEAYIDPSFSQAKRLAQLGGFEYEGMMRGFYSDGSDRELWARVRT